ncbi:sigma-54-dependent transcriptional regulator [Alteribacillus bidgolensis]|uniref:Two-component system, NtrC family, response regulator n=1 Tax=Alteribacillus bidgolensis TaxID=930129 RepID=A0A1G8K2E3_9BACI|nr:sigma-54 dependent transcriptional regulator [Alteribacillus bidgolensis]SDI37601.1 two-component system, NtrC family, response regulator [Alteribacillus bidgolensis]
MRSILLVDDEHKLLKIFQVSLKKRGYTVFTAANGQEARNKIRELEVDIIFLDLKLPDCSGVDLLREFTSLYPKKIYILMTAYANVENAVTAMKAGAFDYIIKPVRMEQISVVIEKALEWLKVKEENDTLKERLKQTTMVDEIFGASSIMKKVFKLVERVSTTDANVLIQGESGTGKSLIAKSIHNLSERSKSPFIPVNCASIPEQLLETELFGHKKGAFTGAQSNRKGKFEAANGGTIFLDEIGEISPAFQAKLLQITQDKTYMPVGSDEVKHIDVRIITATNRDLRKMVESELFREDLYYRLNIVDICIPPLRKSKDDIPLLLEKFLEGFRKKDGRNYTIDRDALNILKNYNWPGNVRELKNAVERAVVLCQGTTLYIDDFPEKIKESKENVDIKEINIENDKPLPEKLESIEKQLILKALDDATGQPATAAKKLGISRQTLLYKMNKYFQKE